MLALAWFLATLVLSGCYSGGQSAARGTFDEAGDELEKLHAWWDAEGKDQAKALAAEASTEASRAAIDAAAAAFQKRVDEAREKLQAEWRGRMEDLERKVAEGRATPLEIALWFLLGGLGAGGTKTVLERVLIGKRNGASNGA